MAQGDGVLYNDFKEQLLKGTHDLGSGGNVLKITLHTGYTPDIDAHQVWADVSATEYATGSGYTAGGITLASQAVTQDNTNNRGAFDAADVTWSALGPLSPATPSHAIVRNSDTNALIGYFELGSTATNGGNYTLQFGANGIILLT